MIKIAIAGNIRSGKNTVGDYFIEHLKCTPIAFADGIVEVIERYFPEAWDNGKPRKHYQIIGQSFRQLNPDIWVEYLDRELDRYIGFTGGKKNIIVTDLRQPNEYEYLKANGFTVIKVEADFDLRLERAKNSGDRFALTDFFHETEMNIESMDYDYLVTNNTTLEDLYAQLSFILEELKGDG